MQPYFYSISINFLNKIITRYWIQSQIIRKLNPTKSPRTPPQSATREENGNASTSFWIWMISVLKIGRKIVPTPSIGITISSPFNWRKEKLSMRISIDYKSKLEVPNLLDTQWRSMAFGSELCQTAPLWICQQYWGINY